MKAQQTTPANLEDEFTFEEAEVVPEENVGFFDNTSRMSQILRALGALIIVASASTFLFQRWDVGSDMNRYFLLLAFTGILSVGGFYCGLRLKESKGARTLLGLTLGITPINFAVVAGLLYSQFSWDGAWSQVPSYASWVAPNATMALVAAASGLAVLAPLGYLSFLSLTRERAKLMAGAFLASNLALWIPTRSPSFIGVVVVTLAFGLCTLEWQRFRGEASLSTFEGRVARLLLWVPPVILIGRTFHLYATSNLFVACLLAVAAVIGFMFGPTLTRFERAKRVVQGASMVPALLSWLHVAYVIEATFHLSRGALLPLVFLPLASILLTASFRAVGGGAAYRRLAAAIALLTTSVNLVAFPGVVSSLLCIGVAVAILLYGFVVEQKLIFFSGVAGVLFGLGYHLKFALKFYSLTSWGSLAVIGVSIIIAASLLEKHQGQIRQKINAFRGRFQSWSY